MTKEKIQLSMAAFLTVSGIGLLVAGICIQPIGIIHESLLIAFGEIATFAGSIIGIDYSYKLKVRSEQKG